MWTYLVCLHHKCNLLCLSGFSYCLTWHLFLSSAYQAHLTASCLASLFSFPFCYFQWACPLPILPSPTYFLCSPFTLCTLALGILKCSLCFSFSSLLSLHVHSHSFTVPRATQVFCSSHSVSPERLFENKQVGFKRVLWGVFFFLFFLPHHLSQTLLTSCAF